MSSYKASVPDNNTGLQDLTEVVTEHRAALIDDVLRKRQPTLTIVFENVHDPHNVGAVLRSCDATGVLSVHGIYTGHQEYPFQETKSGSSALKWVDVTLHNSVNDCYNILRAEGFTILTTALGEDATDLYSANLTDPVAIVLGNEHSGVSEEAIAKGDGNILIPQVGMVKSLNISVACAVILYEAYRQRAHKGMYSQPMLPAPQLELLRKQWRHKRG